MKNNLSIRFFCTLVLLISLTNTTALRAQDNSFAMKDDGNQYIAAKTPASGLPTAVQPSSQVAPFESEAASSPEDFRMESEDGRWKSAGRLHQAKLANLGEDFVVGEAVGPQDFYLPISTKSETAKAAYYEAMLAAVNAGIPIYKEQINKALQADSNFFMAYVHKSMASASSKEYDDVTKLVHKALRLPSAGLTKAELIMRKLMEQWQQDPKAGVAKVMEELTLAYPETPQAFEWASLTAVFIDNNKPAGLTYAQKLAALRPDYAPTYNTLGYLYMGMGQMEQAKAAFENQIRLAPKEANAYDSMGEYYLTVKDYAKSAEYYDKAVVLGLEGSKEGAKKARELMKQ